MKSIRVDDIGQLELELAIAERQVGRPGSCSTRYVRGREAVMPQSRLIVKLADCEFPCVLPEEVRYGA